MSRLGALSEADFRFYFLSQAVTQLGNQIAPIALVFGVLEVSESFTAVGVVLAARIVPTVMLLPIGGVWSDRVSRKRVLITVSYVRCATQAATAVLLVVNSATILNLAALQCVAGAAIAFGSPAATGLTPQTVSAGRLQEANALVSLTRSSASIGGPAIGGALVILFTPAGAIAIDALSFATSAMLLAKITAPAVARREKSTFADDFAQGWRELRRVPWAWTSILGFMAFQLVWVAPVYVVAPVFTAASYGGPEVWAIILCAMGIGSVVGDVVAARCKVRRPLAAGRIVLLASSPLPVLALGLYAPVSVVVIASVLAGFGLTFSDTLWYTTLQRNVPPGSISRVSSYDWLGSSLLRPLGYAAVGPIATHVGPGVTLVGAGVGAFIIHVAVLCVRSVRHVGDTPDV